MVDRPRPRPRGLLHRRPPPPLEPDPEEGVRGGGRLRDQPRPRAHVGDPRGCDPATRPPLPVALGGLPRGRPWGIRRARGPNRLAGGPRAPRPGPDPSGVP